MPCFKPLTMYPPAPGKGARFVCSPEMSFPGAESVQVGCGKCAGCRTRKTGEWVMRNLWELRQHSAACFLTLTYATAHLPPSYSVEIRELQRFVRALRKVLCRRFGRGFKIRFYAVGEYGEKADCTMRPHWHVILYGWRPDDLVQIENSQRGLPQFVSEFLGGELDRDGAWVRGGLWGKGRVTVGDVDAHSISYVAGYVFDKRYGDRAKEFYANRVHAGTGEVVPAVRAPFNVMSRRPGIGQCWLDEQKDKDALSSSVWDRRVGALRPMPRFVVRKLLAAMPSDVEREAFKAKRREAAKAHHERHAADNTPARLATRHAVHLLKVGGLDRGASQRGKDVIDGLFEEAGELAKAARAPLSADERALRAGRALRKLNERIAFGDAALKEARAAERFSRLEARASARREQEVSSDA